MATLSTLEVFTNADQTLRFDVVTVDGGASPQTMTGWALDFVIRKVNGQRDLVVSKTTSAGITIGNGNGTDDRATVAIADTDLIAVPGRDYEYALWRTTDGSDVPLAYGPCIVRRAAGQTTP